MFSISPGMATAVVLLLLAAFLSAGVVFGFIQILLILALAATAAMHFAFLAVAWSKDGD
ncbi:hypothetical protein [Borborobacter arsenicus]|uniref:hypothetical protein n=1 Tax=Borborobacter arsenicus TaxID=1851146 RepID=UPI001404441C|nr:hypothetical protein [Pseudaminobacter arsenicus]